MYWLIYVKIPDVGHQGWFDPEVQNVIRIAKLFSHDSPSHLASSLG